MTLSSKEVLALLRIGLEDETDLPVPVLAALSFITDAAKATALTDSEARESTPCAKSNASHSRGGQSISPIPTNRALILLATLPTKGNKP